MQTTTLGQRADGSWVAAEGWVIDLTWTDDDECVGVALRSVRDEPPAVTTSLIRTINWATVIDIVQRARRADRVKRRAAELEAGHRSLEYGAPNPKVPDFMEVWRAAMAPYGEEARDIERAWARMRRGRTPFYPPEHYERVADLYRRNADSGSPTKAVAEQWTPKPVPRSTANKWVAKARELGLIENAGRYGRPKKRTP